jgi:autotransporter-associated beta strand protein
MTHLSSPRSLPLGSSIAILLAIAAARLSIPSAVGAAYVWDGNPGVAGAQDGGGLWDTLASNWINAGTNVPWLDSNDATFGAGIDGNYAVSVALNPLATSLIFNNSGYTLNAAATQTITVSNAAASIVLATGMSATIGNNVTVTTPAISANSAVTGLGTLIIDNGGTLKNSGTVSSNVLNINSATVEVKTGGSLLTNPIAGGNGNAIFVNGTLNVTGGNVSAVGTLGIGQSGAAGTTAGTLTISTGTVAATSTNGIRFGANSGSTPGGTLNLDGGLLTAAILFKGSGTVASSVVNFNGGTLRASASSATYLQGLTRANVRNGGAIIDSNGRNITIAQALEHSDIIADNATDGGLMKLGAGTLILNGTNTYTGATTINGGALQFGATGLPATGNITVNGAGALNVTGPFVTVGDWLGSGRITTGSSGSLALTADSSDNITLGAYGNLMIGASVNSFYTGTITPSGLTYRLGGGTATLTLVNPNALTGARDVVVGATGSTGTIVLADVNDYTGGTTLNGSTLSAFDETNLGALSGALTFNGGILGVTGGGFTSTSRTINWGAGGGGFDVSGGLTFTVSQTLPSGGGLTKAGGGTLVVSGNNGFSGTSSLNAGALQLTNSAALGTSTLTSVSATAQLQLSNSVTITNPVRLVGIGLSDDGALKSLDGINTLTDFGLSGVGGTRINVVSGSVLNLPNPITLGIGAAIQNLRVIGSGTLFLGGDNSAVVTPANSFLLGRGSELGPTVRVGHNSAFGQGTIDFQPFANASITSSDSTPRTIANALRFSDLFANQVTFGAPGTGDLAFSGATTLSGNLEATIQNTTTTLSGSISGAASLTKLGPGTLALDGLNANRYSAGTVVTEGMLDVRKAAGLGSGDAFVSSGATLKLEMATGNDYISDSGRLMLATGSPVVELAFSGTPDTIAALSFDGGVTFAAPGIWGSPASGAQFTSPVFIGTGTLLVVPEPRAASLFISCCAILGLRRRRG